MQAVAGLKALVLEMLEGAFQSSDESAIFGVRDRPFQDKY